jgi:hypothetical protein
VDEYATALYESVVAAVPGWIERSVAHVVGATGTACDAGVAEAAAGAGVQAQSEVGPELLSLLETDIDDQRTTPLNIVRAAVPHATAVLEAAGIPPVQRDETRRRLFPDDLYDLSPASLGEIDAGLTEPGLIWGAQKAMAHLQRHGRP